MKSDIESHCLFLLRRFAQHRHDRGGLKAIIDMAPPRFPDANSFTTWDGYLIKRFFKENQFELKLQVNDILNQNKGYNRNFSSYSYTETYYETLKRFWLLTATWNISKNGKPTKMF